MSERWMVDLSAIKARAEAATEGPWFLHVMSRAYVGSGKPGSLDFVVHASSDALSDLTDDAAARACDDAEFIAHARTDVPALVAEVERLRAGVTAVRAWAARNKTGYYDEAQDDVVALLAEQPASVTP